MVVRQGGWTVKAAAKGKPRGPARIESTWIRWFSRWSGREARLQEQWQKKANEAKKSQGRPPVLSPLR